MQALTPTQAGLLAMLATRGPYHRYCGWSHSTWLARSLALHNLVRAGLVEEGARYPRNASAVVQWRITAAGRRAIDAQQPASPEPQRPAEIA